MHRLLLSYFLLLFTLNVNSQSTFIQGTVIDVNSREPLIGVNVIVSESKGTITNWEGYFSIGVEPGIYYVNFKYLGYETIVKEVTAIAGDTVTVNVEMGTKAKELDIIVVTGSKFKRRVADETVSIDVLKADIIKSSNDVTLAEGVDKISGFTILDNQPSIRGGSGYSYGIGSRVLVLVDDLPLLTADKSDIRWNYIPMEIMEQVEVIKGSASALYGASSLNGVLNITTAYPHDKPETEVTTFFQLYGPPKRSALKWWGKATDENITKPEDPKQRAPYRVGASFSHMRKIDRFDIVLGANILQEKGFIRHNDQFFGRFSGKFRHRPANNERLSYGINLNLMYSKESDFFLWENNDEGAYIPLGSDSVNDVGTLNQSDKQNLTFDPFVIYYDKKDNRHMIRTRYNYYAQQFDVNKPKAHILMAEYQLQRTFKRKLTLTTGASAEYYIVKDQVLENHTASKSAAFGQVEKEWGKLNASLGLRWEVFKLDDDVGFAQPIGTIGLNYQVGERSYLRFSVGQGYRFPSVAERFVDTQLEETVSIFPNEDIQPEYGVTGELGFKQGITISKWLAYFDFAFFWQEYFDLIEFLFDFYQGEGLGFKSINISRARVAGYELTLQGDGKMGNIPLRVQGGYTYIYPVELGENGDSTLRNVGKYMRNFFSTMFSRDSNTVNGLLKYRYRHVFKIDLEADIKKFTLGTELQYYSFMDRIDDYFRLLDATQGTGINEYREGIEERKVTGDIIWNLRFGYNFEKYGQVTFIVNNVVNREYALRVAKMEPPVNFVVQYRIKI